jgi:BlaI family penicillinase repressor
MPDPETAITDAEWRLLEALWTLERATARQVTDELHDSTQWAYSTVKTMLDRMAAKGLVDARQVGPMWEFAPAVRADEARRSAWRRFVTSAFGGAVSPALAFIASEARLTKKQREELLDALEANPKRKGDTA